MVTGQSVVIMALPDCGEVVQIEAVQLHSAIHDSIESDFHARHFQPTRSNDVLQSAKAHGVNEAS